MSDNRNSSSCFSQDARGTVCIDTHRVLDSCRDRDCFEGVRVYLTTYGEDILSSATNVRTKSAKVLWAYVGVDEVPFNCGFYQVTVRYYILVELEACLGIGRSQTFNGISVLEKQVILYGGEGSVTTFTSGPDNNFCSVGGPENMGTNGPTAIVETVEPIVLSTKVVECGCRSTCCESIDLPECVRGCLGSDVCCANNGTPALYLSYGMFSVIRIVRPAQLLVQASDYSVPDKECVAASNNEDPCSVFNNMPFPISRFRGIGNGTNPTENQRGKGCGCGK